MSKLWLVARQQFRHTVYKRSFVLGILALPFFLLFTVGIGVLAERAQRETTTLGFVDPGNFLAEAPPDSDTLHLQRFADASAARAALDAETIDLYFVLPADYPQNRQTELVFTGQPDSSAVQVFTEAVRSNLLADQTAEVRARILDGPAITVHALARGRSLPLDFPGLGVFLPMLAAMLFAFWAMTITSTLMEALVTEKQNRTIEVIVSSMSPGQMMGGKIIGVFGMSLLLLFSWVAMLALFAWFGSSVLGWEWLSALAINWRDLGLLALAALPAFLCITALMVMLGGIMVDTQEAQQISGFSFIFLFAPIYLLGLLANAPDSPLALIFSFFPLTSVMTLAIRSIFMAVPTWQFLLAAGIGLLLAALLIWLAGRVFRANMLRYGQGLRLRRKGSRAATA